MSKSIKDTINNDNDEDNLEKDRITYDSFQKLITDIDSLSLNLYTEKLLLFNKKDAFEKYRDKLKNALDNKADI